MTDHEITRVKRLMVPPPGGGQLTLGPVDITTMEQLDTVIRYMKMEDGAHRFDRDCQLSGDEKLVDAKLAALRSAIRRDGQKRHIYKDFPPAIPFCTSKAQIDSDQSMKDLRDLLHVMPKGGNLHSHTNACWNAKEFLTYLASQPDVYFCTQDIPDSQGLPMLKTGTVLCFDGVVPPALTYAKLTAQNVDDLVKQWTMTDRAAYDALDYVWDEFNLIFQRCSPILEIEKYHRYYYQKTFEALWADNVTYLELRCGLQDFVPNHNSYLTGTRPVPTPDPDPNSIYFLTVMQEELTAFQAIHPEFDCKLILTASRAKAVASSIQKLQKVWDWWLHQKTGMLRSGHPFVIGFDFVGEEDAGIRTRDYADEIYKINGFDMPLYFHDGESNWSDNDNLFSAYLLGSKRVGHGFALGRYAQLTPMVNANHMALECCPISNQMLRYTGDLRAHPIYSLMKQDVQCVVASDDPQLFGNDGLTYDFWMLYVAGDLDLRGLKTLVYNSIDYSGMDDAEKAAARARLDLNWAAFIQNNKQ